MNSNFALRWTRRWGPPAGLFALVLIAVLIASVINRYADLSRWSAHTHEVIEQISLVETRLERLETAGRGFLLTHDEKYLKIYDSNRSELPLKIETLRQLTLDNPSQTRRIDQFQLSVEAHIDKMRDALAMSLRAGRMKVTDIETIQPLRDMTSEMHKAEGLLLDQRTAGADRFARIATVLMVLLVLTAVFLVTFAHVSTQRVARANAAQAGLLQSIFESIGDGLVVTNMDGEITHHNRYAGQILGVDFGQVRTVGELGLVTQMPPESSPTRRALRGEHVNNQELQLNLNDQPRTINIDSRPVVSDGGAMVGALAIVRDVTERRNLENEWKNARESALEASRLKSDFLATMSHEIRTPMNGVVGMSTILMDTSLDEDQRSYVRTIKSSADSLLALINQVLDHAKIESGKLQLVDTDFNVADLFDNVLDLFRYLARSKAVDLRLDLGHEVPLALNGDADRLRQIVINLVGNALKFTEQGYVEVMVRHLNADQAGNGEKHRIEVTVRDTGRGMSQESLAKLFGKFSQVHDVRLNKGGSGLGLMISRELVHAMGGEISVESAEGFGSRFSFTVLLDTALTCPIRPQVSARDRKLRGRVLVAEDQPVNQLVIRKYLEQLGVSHVIVPDGEACLKALGREHFDLVLMDCQMRPMDGYQATKRIRANESSIRAETGKAARMPIVALTAEGMSGDRRRCFEVGMDAFLSKPIVMENLHAMLKKYLPEQPVSLVKTVETDVTAIRKLDGFESDGKPLAVVLYEEFTTGGRNDLDKLTAAAGSGNWEDVRYLAHSLKSSGRTLGLIAFGNLCEKLEHEGDGQRVLEQDILQLQKLHTDGCAWLDQQLGSGKVAAN